MVTTAEPAAGSASTPAPQLAGLGSRDLGRAATGGRLFSEFQRRNIKHTLAAMQADFEGSATGTDEPSKSD